MTHWFEVANAHDVDSPALLIYPARVAENLQRMIRMAGGVQRMRPHVKTHKLPQIVELKLQAGIDKFKASTIAEAEMTAAAGGRDIVLAYQCVGPAGRRLTQLVRRFPETQFASLVDNPGTLAELSGVAQSANVTLTLLVDLNVGMDRTGIALGPEAIALYRQIDATPGVVAGGLHAYDGHLHHRQADEQKAATQQVRQRVKALITELKDGGLGVPKLIAGGTPTSPHWATDSETVAEVGAGTTVLWDYGQADVCPDMDYLNAAVLMSRVISRPTADRICVDLGHKSVAAEMPQPRVRWFGLEDAEPVLQNEEHLVLRTKRAADYPVGTVLYGIPRHICPTVALQSEVVVVRDGRAIDRWPVVARARRISI